MHNCATWLRLLLLDSINYREPFTAGRAAVNGLGHALQTATRAERDGASHAEIVMALCHDVMRPLTDIRHGEAIAEVMADRLPERCVNALRHHGELGSDYVHGTSFSRQYYGEPWYETAVRLQGWDAASFAVGYPSFRLDHFLPLLEEVCIQ